MRLNRFGFTSFGDDDDVAEQAASAILTFPTGEMALVSGLPKSYRIELSTEPGHAGPGFRHIQPRFPSSIKSFGVGRGSLLVRDDTGESWIPTHEGLARFPSTRSVARLDGLLPSKIFTVADGLPSNNVASIFEDSRGDIWIALRFPPKFALVRWVRILNRVEDLTDALPAWPSRAVTAYAESRSGAVWFGLGLGAAARYKDGRFQLFASGNERLLRM
jgi:hypothetical protein